MIFSRGLSTEEVSALYDSYNNDLYYDFSGLDSGEYTFKAYVQDQAGNVNSTEERFFKVNYVPNATAVVLNATSTENLTQDNLTLHYSVFDSDNDDVKNITTWFVDNYSITVLNMPFDGNLTAESRTKVRDYSGYGNNGTVNATWNRTAGYDGRGAYQFDGTGQVINAGNDESLSITGDLTILARVYPKSLSGRTLISKHYNSEFDLTFWTSLTYYNGPDWSNGNSHSFSYSFSDDNWYHIAFTRKGSTKTVKLYVDGIDTADDFVYNDIPLSSNNDLGIGYRLNASRNSFYGTIDEVMIFNRTLSVEQIKVLYENKTDIIVSEETDVLQTWHAVVVPNDNYDDGTLRESNNVTIRDVVPPRFENEVNTSIDFRKHSNFTANITINDEALSSYKFSTNASGIWLNQTAVSISGKQANVSANANITVGQGNSVCWYYYAIDTSVNENSSDIYCFIVDNTVVSHSDPYIGAHEPTGSYMDSAIVAYYKFENGAVDETGEYYLQ
jgi:hypothetical protein